VEENAGFFASIERADVRGMERPDLIAVVPGAFHREHPGSGADGARVMAIAREIDCAAAVIPVPGFGRLEDNARQIADWLGARRDRRIAVVSLSKGDPCEAGAGLASCSPRLRPCSALAASAASQGTC
jgi:hypothetical protein